MKTKKLFPLKTALRVFCFISCVLFFYKSFSNEAWITSRNKEELEQIINSQKKQEELKVFCELQIRKKKVPWACYEWIQKRPSSEKEFFLSYFNEKCGEFSRGLKNFRQIKKILQQKNLSDFCRKKVRRQKNRLKYKMRDRPFSEIRRWHLTEGF